MRCSAIVVTYNSGAAITACLEALAREDCEIIVVDNASADDTLRRVEDVAVWHPVRLLANQRKPWLRRGGQPGSERGDRRCAADPESRRGCRARVGRRDTALHGLHSGRRCRRCAAGSRRPTRARLRLSPAAHALGFDFRSNTGQPAMARQPGEPALPLPRRRLLTAAGGRPARGCLRRHTQVSLGKGRRLR